MVTPEERLLGLIRSKRGNAQEASARGQSEAVQHGPSKKGAGKGSKVKWATWTKWVSVLLGLVLIGELAVIVNQMTKPMPRIEMPRTVLSTDSRALKKMPSLEQLPQLSMSVGHELFPPPKKPAPPPPTPVKKPKVSEESMALGSRLSLTGMIEGNPPQVIIEDSQNGSTMFVTQGQVVVDGAVLEEVSSSGVVLDYYGEKIRLGL